MWSSAGRPYPRLSRSAGAAHGVHDDVGGQLLFGTAVAFDHSYAADALAIRRCSQLCHVVAVENRDVFNGLESSPDVLLQEWPARLIHGVCLGIEDRFAGSRHQVSTEGDVKPGVFGVVPNGSTVGDQLIKNPREELTQSLGAARQQGMGVPALRNPPPVSGFVEQHVTFDHVDGLEIIGEHSGGQQSAHARSQYDRAFTQYRHGESPNSPPQVRQPNQQ
jgi:hypothetical protein